MGAKLSMYRSERSWGMCMVDGLYIQYTIRHAGAGRKEGGISRGMKGGEVRGHSQGGTVLGYAGASESKVEVRARVDHQLYDQLITLLCLLIMIKIR
jgi:hypothetical protein